MADIQVDRRFQECFAWEVTTGKYDMLRGTWTKHVAAEEKLSASHSEEEEERRLETLRDTMTDDCA